MNTHLIKFHAFTKAKVCGLRRPGEITYGTLSHRTKRIFSRHTAHAGPCLRLPSLRPSIIDDQRNGFLHDSRTRALRLSSGDRTLPVFAFLQKTRVGASEKGAPGPQLPRSLCTLINSFCKVRVITNFIDELHLVRHYQRPGHITGAIVTRHSFEVPRSLHLFKNLFVANAGVLGLCRLPQGAYFTGSMCCAGGTVPRCVAARATQIEALRPPQFAVPLLLVRWFRERIGTWVSYVDLFLAPSIEDANAYLEDFNDALGKGTSYFGQEDIAANELDDFEARLGPGLFARADIDIIIVAKDDEEAKTIITQTLALVRTAVGAHIVVKTPNSLTVIPDFPLKHIQIITLWNGSLAEYFDFVDLDCTALAFDGACVYGSPRALLAWTSRLNVVHPDMLSIRRDTPARIAKYCQRGFGSFLLGQDPGNSPEKQQDIDRNWMRSWELSLRGTGRMMDHGGGDEVDYAQFLLEAHGSCYSENRLPRGLDITPKVVEHFLNLWQDRARREDRRLVVKLFERGDIITCTHKLGAKTERWWRWGLV